jgi:recombination protein RecR
MNNLDKLITYFERFPGIGARQARRFAFHILNLPAADTTELSELIASLKSSVTECTSCHRFFARNGGTAVLCRICDSQHRDHSKLLIVASDNDIQAIERSGVYEGLYFVLGGTIPLLSDTEPTKLRGGTLKVLVEERRTASTPLSEVILGFPVNPDGENTARYVEGLLTPLLSASLTISHLGRGLSTGSELEYADPETIKSALLNRH